MKKQVAFEEWLDDKGFGIFVVVQGDGSDGEYILARACIEEGVLYIWEELLQSKHISRLLKRYQHELQTNTEIIMDVRETLLGLSIDELESLKPSYYQFVINERIAELEAEEKNNAVTKTKRKRKRVTKTTN